VIWGTEDQVISAAHAQNAKIAKVGLIDDAGHMVQMEKAARVNQLRLDHLLG
jgi:pyruvate dehydrogenase E2 component (dihydrolipoamide acetyltransferase)